MVSMVQTSNPDQNDTVMAPVVPKSEPNPDGSISSAVSTPDAEAEPSTQDPARTQKRKGGRKPVRNACPSTSMVNAGIRGPAFVMLPPPGGPVLTAVHVIFMFSPSTDILR